jgi:hypothetical protein
VKIVIKDHGCSIEVDPVELPGSPAVGRGRTIEEALGNFLIAYQDKLGLKIEIDESAKAAEILRRERALAQR